MIGSVFADELLQGPRGRRLCWELTGQWSYDLPAPSSQQLRACVDSTADLLRIDDEQTGLRLFEALQRSTDVAMYWQEPDECDARLADEGFADALRPIAEAVAASVHGRWWDSGLADSDQHCVALTDDSRPAQWPRLDGAAERLAQWRARVDASNAQMRRLRTGDADKPFPRHGTGWVPVPGRAGGARQFYSEADGWGNISGCWWSAPVELTATSRALPGRGPLGLWLVEDAATSSGALSWPVRPAASTRVFEITGADAWADLVLRYPVDVSDGRGPDWQHCTGRRGSWLMPDWQSVAERFDAVHLPVAGYLSGAGRPVTVGPGAASVIAGWAPDTTYWLTDALTITGPHRSWAYDRSDESWRVAAGNG